MVKGSTLGGVAKFMKALGLMACNMASALIRSSMVRCLRGNGLTEYFKANLVANNLRLA